MKEADGTARARAGGRAVVAMFSATLLLSAFLLFIVQPLFAKMVLPVLGGSPGVWSVAMVVFQGLLLAGYAYAHLLVRHLPPVPAAGLHLAVTLAAFAALPIGIAHGWDQPPPDGEALWLVGLFLASIGPPFFAVSANGPLLQAWFGRTGVAGSGDPYFLYAASNIGSFAALLAYPLLVEPVFALQAQALGWSIGFGLLAAGLAACAAVALRGARGAAVRGAEGSAEGGDRDSGPALAAPPPSLAERARWTALGLLPSALLVAVTAHIATEVASAPLLWVVPLALYLLTFVLAFRARPPIPEGLLLWLQLLGTLVALPALMFPAPGFLVALLLGLGLFFVDALLCHAALYRRRPPAARLTEFYLCMSFGGMLGGLFAALLAPRMFSTVVEYPLLLVAALLVRPGLAGGPLLRRIGLPLAGLGVLLAGGFAAGQAGLAPVMVTLLLLGLFGIGMLAARRAPWAVLVFAGGLAGLEVGTGRLGTGPTESFRSFFGVHRIATTPDGTHRLLFHGTTIHGAMRIRAADGTPYAGPPEPATYYYRGGPIWDVLSVAREARGEGLREARGDGLRDALDAGAPQAQAVLSRVAVIGLGAGSLACARLPGEAWSFYEIDAEVIRIARDPARFRFLSACAPDAAMVQGDARLTLARETQAQSVILVDAFSSDAIPTHLLTREAIGLYLAKLDDRGLIALHITNRYFELSRIIARVAAGHGLTALLRRDLQDEPVERNLHAAANVMILARDTATVAAAERHGWVRLPATPGGRPWSDDFANILEAMRDRLRAPDAGR